MSLTQAPISRASKPQAKRRGMAKACLSIIHSPMYLRDWTLGDLEKDFWSNAAHMHASCEEKHTLYSHCPWCQYSLQYYPMKKMPVSSGLLCLEGTSHVTQHKNYIQI